MTTVRALAILLLAATLAGCGGEAAQPTALPATEIPAVTFESRPQPTEEPQVSDPLPTAPEAAVPENFDACTLLTPEEAELVVGAPIGEPEQIEPIMVPGGSSVQICRYRADAFNDLRVTVYRFNDPEAAATQYGFLGDLGEDSETIPGLGDQSFVEEDANTRLGMLTILDGPYFIDIGTLTDAENRLENLKVIAPLILERLP